jgi:hypothetical protein
MGKFSKKINYELFTTNFTPESVYILGLLWADGYLEKKSNLIRLECVMEDILEFYPVFMTTGEFSLSKRQRLNRKEQGIINGSSLELSNFLKENDYSEKTFLSPTKILKLIPIDLLKFFYLGWSDGDGCFYNNKNYNCIQFIISGSYNQNWESLITLCDELKITYKIDRFITKKSHRYSRFLINRNEDILKFGNFIYTETNIGLKRKKDKFNSIKTYINEKNSSVFVCYDRMGNEVNRFKTLKLASDWLNRGRYVGSSIRDSIIGRQPTAYNYIWKEFKQTIFH